MRLHDRPTETVFDAQTEDITVPRCDVAIELLIQRIVGCCCSCPGDMLELQKWRDRKASLLALPVQRDH